MHKTNNIIYTLIDNKSPIKSIHQTTNFDDILNEYLLAIDNELKIITSLNVKVELQNLINTDMYILMVLDSRNPFALNKISFNYFSLSVQDENTGFTFAGPNNLSQSMCVTLILKSISNSITKITGFDQKLTHPGSQSNNEINLQPVYTRKVLPPCNTRASNNHIVQSANLNNSNNSTRFKPMNTTIIPGKIGRGNIPDTISIHSNESDYDEFYESNNLDDSLEHNDLTETTNSNDSNIDINKLKKELDDLTKMQNSKIQKLNIMKEKLDADKKEYSNQFNTVNDERRFWRRDKEREEERKRVFTTDKHVYRMLKSEIEMEIRDKDNIPELFANKYPIFAALDEEKQLDLDGDYDLYVELYNEFYPSTKKSTNVDEIDNFIEKKCSGPIINDNNPLIKSNSDNDNDQEESQSDDLSECESDNQKDNQEDNSSDISDVSNNEQDNQEEQNDDNIGITDLDSVQFDEDNDICFGAR